MIIGLLIDLLLTFCDCEIEKWNRIFYSNWNKNFKDITELNHVIHSDLFNLFFSYKNEYLLKTIIS